MQAEAKKEASGLNNISFLEGDIEGADFPNRSFDVILCSSAIFYFNMQITAKRLHTWLKPGGLLAYNTLQVTSPSCAGCPVHKVCHHYCDARTVLSVKNAVVQPRS